MKNLLLLITITFSINSFGQTLYLNGDKGSPSLSVIFNDDKGTMQVTYDAAVWNTDDECECETRVFEMQSTEQGMLYVGFIGQYNSLQVEVQQGFINNAIVTCDEGRNCDAFCCDPKTGMYQEVFD